MRERARECANICVNHEHIETQNWNDNICYFDAVKFHVGALAFILFLFVLIFVILCAYGCVMSAVYRPKNGMHGSLYVHDIE